MKKRIITKISQLMANVIVDRLSKSESSDEIDFWFNIGMQLDIYLTVMHDIYLD